MRLVFHVAFHVDSMAGIGSITGFKSYYYCPFYIAKPSFWTLRPLSGRDVGNFHIPSVPMCFLITFVDSIKMNVHLIYRLL